MLAAMREAAEQAGVETRELAGVGVGSPGDADEKTGVVSGAAQPARLGSARSRSASTSPTQLGVPGPRRQ